MSSSSAHDRHHHYQYHQYHRRLWHLARTRPVLAVGVTSFTVAGVVETYARVRTFLGTRPPHNSSSPNNGTHDDYYTLPRSYDREAIRHYWLCRPLSVLGRVGQIMASLGPVGCQWYLEQQSSSPSLDEQQQQQQRQQYHAIQLRQALTHLGPAWVKGGQQLAIRPDLVPPVVLKELSTLCDAVTPVDDEIAWQLLRDELKIDDLSLVFQNIQLVASASLGQVYQATLVQEPNAPTVAIKVQRPGMREAFSLDLFLLQQWGELMDSLTSIFTHQQLYHRAFLDAYSKGSYSVRRRQRQ
jgi:ABC1 atypical kinase-like domain